MDMEKYIQSLQPYKRKKYGVTKECPYCKEEFITSYKKLNYCSKACSNPQNRAGDPNKVAPWNKGHKKSAEHLATMNTEGLKKGHGWQKKPEYKEAAKRAAKMHSERMKGSNNPNWEGKQNNLRPKAPVDNEWNKYKKEVRKVTYRSVYQMKKEGLVPDGVGKYKGMLQLDHIISKRQGYEQNIDPWIIGHRNNLRYVSSQVNREKWHTFQTEEVVKEITNELQRPRARSLQQPT
jgi:hypothetical protein